MNFALLSLAVLGAGARHGQDGDKNLERDRMLSLSTANQLSLKMPHQRIVDTSLSSNSNAMIYRDSEGEVHSVNVFSNKVFDISQFWLTGATSLVVSGLRTNSLRRRQRFGGFV